MFKIIGGMTVLAGLAYGFLVGYRAKKNNNKVLDVVKSDYLILGVKAGFIPADCLEVKSEE